MCSSASVIVDPSILQVRAGDAEQSMFWSRWDAPTAQLLTACRRAVRRLSRSAPVDIAALLRVVVDWDELQASVGE